MLEALASAGTIAGMALGSTECHGIIVYFVGQIFWFWLIAVTRMWGLVPLNVVTTIVLIYNAYRVIHS